MARSMIVAAALALSLVAAGCEKKDSATAPKAGGTTDSLKDAASGAVDAAKQAGAEVAAKATAALEEAKTKFLGEAQTQLDGVKKQIDAWKPKVEALVGDLKKPAQDALAGVESKFTAAQGEFTKVKDGGVDSFDSLKTGLSKSLTELSDAVKSFTDKFKF